MSMNCSREKKHCQQPGVATTAETKLHPDSFFAIATVAPITSSGKELMQCENELIDDENCRARLNGGW